MRSSQQSLLTFQMFNSSVSDSATFTCVVTDTFSGEEDTAKSMMVIFEKVNLINREDDVRSQRLLPFRNRAPRRSQTDFVSASLILISIFVTRWSPQCVLFLWNIWYQILRRVSIAERNPDPLCTISVDVRGWCWVAAIVNINNRLIISLQTMNQRWQVTHPGYNSLQH